MSKRNKSRGSRETSLLLEQMGVGTDDEAPPPVQATAPAAPPAGLTQANKSPAPSAVARGGEPQAASPPPAKGSSRALLWVLILAVLAAAAGGAAYFLLGQHP